MNDLSKFSANSALSYSSDMEARKRTKLFNEAARISKIVDGKYEKLIKKKLFKDPKCRQIKIGLGYFHQLKGSDFYDVEKMVREHFSVRGFEIEMSKGKSCNCVFDIVCNHNQSYVTLSW